MTRTCFFLILAAGASLGYGQVTQVFAVSPPTIAPNSAATLNIVGTGFTPGSDVQFTSPRYSTTVAATFVSSDQVSVVISLPKGGYEVTVRGANGAAQWLTFNVAQAVTQANVS